MSDEPTAEESKLLALLSDQELPRWEFAAQAAHYVAGHRGLLDAGLDFPAEYLKEPVQPCFVWRQSIEDETRVHAYADTRGRFFHISWRKPGKSKEQSLPEHREGVCPLDSCKECAAAELVAATYRGENVVGSS